MSISFSQRIANTRGVRVCIRHTKRVVDCYSPTKTNKKRERYDALPGCETRRSTPVPTTRQTDRRRRRPTPSSSDRTARADSASQLQCRWSPSSSPLSSSTTAAGTRSVAERRPVATRRAAERRAVSHDRRRASTCTRRHRRPSGCRADWRSASDSSTMV